MYGLHKINKIGASLRPIVASIDSVMLKLSKELTQIFHQLPDVMVVLSKILKNLPTK